MAVAAWLFVWCRGWSIAAGLVRVWGLFLVGQNLVLLALSEVRIDLVVVSREFSPDLGVLPLSVLWSEIVPVKPRRWFKERAAAR